MVRQKELQKERHLVLEKELHLDYQKDSEKERHLVRQKEPDLVHQKDFQMVSLMVEPLGMEMVQEMVVWLDWRLVHEKW